MINEDHPLAPPRRPFGPDLSRCPDGVQIDPSIWTGINAVILTDTELLSRCPDDIELTRVQERVVLYACVCAHTRKGGRSIWTSGQRSAKSGPRLALNLSRYLATIWTTPVHHLSRPGVFHILLTPRTGSSAESSIPLRHFPGEPQAASRGRGEVGWWISSSGPSSTCACEGPNRAQTRKTSTCL